MSLTGSRIVVISNRKFPPGELHKHGIPARAGHGFSQSRHASRQLTARKGTFRSSTLLSRFDKLIGHHQSHMPVVVVALGRFGN